MKWPPRVSPSFVGAGRSKKWTVRSLTVAALKAVTNASAYARNVFGAATVRERAVERPRRFPVSRRTQLLIIVAVAILMRLPFLNQAVAGDDVYFLYGAEHALTDPLHPLHAQFAFRGQVVDMRGHTHGPVDPWILSALIVIFGSVREVPFHLVYILFSLIAALAAWSIASRFSDRALEAVLLFFCLLYTSDAADE